MIEHVFRGFFAVQSPTGEILWESGLLENALMNQGEQDVLNVYLREQAHKTKYLGLFDLAGLVDPPETNTIADLYPHETVAPGTNGYARQQMLAADWGAPFLSGDDYRSESAAGKVFGPPASATLTFSHVIMVTTASGATSPATLALAYIALGTQISLAVGLTFTYTPSISAF